MMSIYENLIGQISNAMYSYILIILLVGGGIFFTLRTKGVQKYLIEAFRIILQPAEDQDKESISAFQSMMISTASRVGTGNIAGVSFAICTGGPGAVFWMWVIAFFGMATAFVEGTLAQIYKRRGENGSCYGGPSYYIESAQEAFPGYHLRHFHGPDLHGGLQPGGLIQCGRLLQGLQLLQR